MRRQRCRSWGTLLDAPDELERPPETEVEYVRYLQQKIADAQERHLLPLKEDVTDWLNATLGEWRNSVRTSPLLKYLVWLRRLVAHGGKRIKNNTLNVNRSCDVSHVCNVHTYLWDSTSLSCDVYCDLCDSISR